MKYLLHTLLIYLYFLAIAMQKKKAIPENENYIELTEIVNPNELHVTPEESRKIIPQEVKNLRMIKQSLPMRYTWEHEGEKLIHSTKLYFTRKEKKMLKCLFLTKMPEKLRKDYWLIASGARKEMVSNANYYLNLTSNFPNNLPSPYESQIEMDLYRTFPGDPFLEDERNILKLKNVLLAYSRRNITIGYCQGFNFIVGRLLMILENEEEAFWVFAQLIEHVLPLNFYSELAGIMVDCAILLKLVKKYLPSLMSHLKSLGFELSINNLLYKWFVSLFIQNMSIDLWKIIWDVLFLDGNIILFKSALALLKIAKDEILSVDTMEEANRVLEESMIHLNNGYTLLFYLLLYRFDFDMTFIAKNREVFIPKILENIKRANEYKRAEMKKMLLQKNSECEKDWQLCMNDLNSNLISNYLIFKVQDPPTVIEDYFDNPDIPEESQEKSTAYFKYFNQSSDYKSLLIERRPHMCDDNVFQGKEKQKEDIEEYKKKAMLRIDIFPEGKNEDNII